jgi:hypothetical protein
MIRLFKPTSEILSVFFPPFSLSPSSSMTSWSACSKLIGEKGCHWPSCALRSRTLTVFTPTVLYSRVAWLAALGNQGWTSTATPRRTRKTARCPPSQNRRSPSLHGAKSLLRTLSLLGTQVQSPCRRMASHGRNTRPVEQLGRMSPPRRLRLRKRPRRRLIGR